MNVKILGGGCANCNKLEANTKDALNELGKEFTLEKVKDYDKILGYGVMKTPALVVDEKVVISGRVATKDEIKELLK